MKLNKQKKVADVLLFNVEVSEAELEIYQQCLEYVLAHVAPKRIEEDFGAYPEEIAGMLEDIRELMQRADVAIQIKAAAA
ncbi:hypothetical protein HUU05_16535 [candidate division KSB1 bacterium]|nr:hypothetical protein [candidate division KSB1 bacterium]